MDDTGSLFTDSSPTSEPLVHGGSGSDENGGQEDINTLGGWCDDVYGWGPTIRGPRDALTMCFCVTAFELPAGLVFLGYAIPRLFQLLEEPLVKPAFSVQHNLKLFFMLVCLFCSILLGLMADPPSPALRISLAVTALGWGVALALIVVGYHRALPQVTCLRLWWVSQFCINILIFMMHQEMETYDVVHDIRGVYCGACVCLAFLSIRYYDQPIYTEVAFHHSNSTMSCEDVLERSSSAPVMNSIGTMTDETPLLIPMSGATLTIGYGIDDTPKTDSALRGGYHMRRGMEELDLDSVDEEDEETHSRDHHSAVKGSNANSDDEEYSEGLKRRLSSNLLFTGASTSKYSVALEAFNQTLYGKTGRRNVEGKSPSFNDKRESSSSQ